PADDHVGFKFGRQGDRLRAEGGLTGDTELGVLGQLLDFVAGPRVLVHHHYFRHPRHTLPPLHSLLASRSDSPPTRRPSPHRPCQYPPDLRHRLAGETSTRSWPSAGLKRRPRRRLASGTG